MLMNKWSTSTWETLVDQKDKNRELWQRVAPAEAVSHPFLMHGILALTALHMASESCASEEEAREHRAAALRHHDRAIALFRPSLEKITAHNCHAIFGFSALLVILSFALPGCPLQQSTKSPVQELLMIITLLKGVQGIRSLSTGSYSLWLRKSLLSRTNGIEGVVTSGLEWIEVGSFSVLLESDLSMTRGEIPDDFKAALSRLKAHNASLYISDSDVVQAYSLTLDQLETYTSRLYARPLHRPVILSWMVTIPDRFNALLRDGEPMAQVILAHFAVILLTFDFWWAGDWGESLIREISQKLPDEWKPMVRWPLEQIYTMTAGSLYMKLDTTSSRSPALEKHGAIS